MNSTFPSPSPAARNASWPPPPWPPPAEDAPPFPPPSPDPLAQLIGIRNVVSDRAITSGLWIDVVVGAVFILLFSLCQSRVKIYRARLTLQSVAVPPPELPSKGLKQFWYWLWAVLATPDVDLLASSGLDALMMVKIVELGIQLFIPLTIFAVAILIPVHFKGRGLTETTANTSQMMKLTVANLKDGSNLLWIHFFLVYIYLIYIMLLLRYRYFEYVKLRQHYLSRGDDVNYWRQCYVPLEKVNIKRTMLAALDQLKQGLQPATQEFQAGALEDRGTPLLDIATFPETANHANGVVIDPEADPPSKRSSNGSHAAAPSAAAAANQAATPEPKEIQLSTRRSLAHNKALGITMPAHVHELRDLRSETLQRPLVTASDPAAVNGEGNGTAAAGEEASVSKLRRSVTADEALLNGRTAPPLRLRDPQIPLQRKAQSQTELYTTTSMPLPKGFHRRSRSTDDNVALLNRQLSSLNTRRHSRRDSGDITWNRWWDSLDMQMENDEEVDVTDEQRASAIEVRVEDGSTADASQHRQPSQQQQPPNAGTSMRKLLAKPSIRYKKTVNTVDRDGRRVAVNAQQYAVLVTDVQDPIYPEMVAKTRHPLYKFIQLLKRTLPSWLAKFIFLFYQRDNPIYGHTDHHHHHHIGFKGMGGLGRPPTKVGYSFRYQAPEEDVETGRRAAGPYSHLSLNSSEADAPVSAAPQLSPTSSAAGELVASPSMANISEKRSHWNKVRKAVRSGALFRLPQDIVTSTFRTLFPNDFVRAIPVFKHEEVDKLLWDWDVCCRRLETAKAFYTRYGKRQKIKLSRWATDQVDALDHFNMRVVELEHEIKVARKQALERAFTPSWFVFFRTQTAATIASSTLLHSEDNYKFQVHPAPGPEDVNWKTLWLDHRQREFRALCVLPFIIMIVLFPIGSFTGGLSMLDVALCSTTNGNQVNWKWYCRQDAPGARWFKRILVGLLPSVLLNLYQNMVMPRVLYYLAQSEGHALSLSGLDRRIGGLYFYWDIFNVFLGGILGASIVGQIDQARQNPGSIIELLGVALPSASNFFISYVVFRAVVLLPFRIFGPHPGLWIYFLKKGLSFFFGNQMLSARDRVEMLMPRSPRYGFEIGLMMLIFLIGMSYSVVAPLLMPFVLIFFLVAYVFWRYILLYVYIRKYESGGIMWPYVFNRLCVCVVIFQFFTSCVFIVKRAYWQAVILWLTVPLFMLKFWRHCRTTFQVGVDGNPLELAMRAPIANVDPWVYIAPPLHETLMGWYPEYMKAWDGWGAPAYGW